MFFQVSLPAVSLIFLGKNIVWKWEIRQVKRIGFKSEYKLIHERSPRSSELSFCVSTTLLITLITYIQKQTYYEIRKQDEYCVNILLIIISRVVFLFSIIYSFLWNRDTIVDDGMTQVINNTFYLMQNTQRFFTKTVLLCKRLRYYSC